MAGGTSYNGWPCNSDKSAINVQPFGDNYGLPFPGGVVAGDVATVLGYVAVQLHERVEACVYGWDWGYEYRENVNNPGSMSCHASGTAIDYNAPNHPNGARGTFNSQQVATIRDILVEVGGAVQWGGDYSGTADEMHFEIIVDADYLHSVAINLPGDGPAPLPPEPEGIVMPLTVVRSPDGIDYAFAEDMSVFVRIPTLGYYNNLTYCGVIDTPHGDGLKWEQNIIDWLRGQVAASGGRVHEPSE